MTALETPAADNAPSYPLIETEVYNATVLTDTSQIDSLAPEWNSFLADAGIENISLRFEWVQAFLRYFPQQKLRVIVLRDSRQRLAALAPFAVNRGNLRFCQRLLRYVRFLGSKEFLYDWMQLPIRQDVERGIAIRYIVQALVDIRHEWDVLDFQSCSNFGELQEFSKQLNAYGGNTEIEPGEAMPKAGLPESLESYETDRSKKRVNRDVKRFTKKLQEDVPGETALHLFESAHDAQDELRSFCVQHKTYWLQRAGSSNFKTYPQLEEFYRHILNVCNKQSGTPYLEFSRLSVNGTPLSYQLGIWHEWGYMNYMNNYNQDYKVYRPGILHMDALFREAIARKSKTFSFGQGEESYKSLWANGQDALWNFRYFKNPLIYHIWHLDFRLKKIKSFLKPFRLGRSSK